MCHQQRPFEPHLFPPDLYRHLHQFLRYLLWTPKNFHLFPRLLPTCLSHRVPYPFFKPFWAFTFHRHLCRFSNCRFCTNNAPNNFYGIIHLQLFFICVRFLISPLKFSIGLLVLAYPVGYVQKHCHLLNTLKIILASKYSKKSLISASLCHLDLTIRHLSSYCTSLRLNCKKSTSAIIPLS
jgi:hypothetical protein